MPRFDGYGVLREREYRRYWLGQWVSLIGTWMQSAAQGWLLISLTGQPAYLGYLGAATSAPMLVFVLFAGTTTDRVDRRRMTLTTQALAPTSRAWSVPESPESFSRRWARDTAS